MSKTVLYVHGLESGPHGRKAVQLAEAGFAVVSELMPCGRAQIVRDPLVRAAGTAGLVALAGSAVARGVVGVAVAVAVGVAAKPVASSHLMRRVLRRSVDVQLRSLAAHNIDVVVGSSFGGAVALELLHSGAWSGPTLLLCPAHQLVADRARRAAPPSLAALPDAVSSRVVVVHGRRDETVPVAHSEALVAGSRAQLVLVDDDHRLTATTSPEQFATWIGLFDRAAPAHDPA